jgi:NADH-quinone oxidoreductase subunit A
MNAVPRGAGFSPLHRSVGREISAQAGHQSGKGHSSGMNAAPRGGNSRLPAGAGVPSFAGMQLQEYVPVLMLLVVALTFAFGALVVSVLVGWRSRRNKTKDTAYECGMLPVGTGSNRMSVKFYLVAMLFILFDIEVVFLYPWAVVYRDMLADPAMRNVILAAMVSFLGILFIGYLYALKKRAFEWNR